MRIHRGLMRVIMSRSPGLLLLVTALEVGLIFTTGNVFGQNSQATVQTERLLRQVETNTDRFSKSIDAALDRSRLNESNLEDQVNALVDEFEFATDRMKERVEDNMVISLDVNEVLRRGMHLDAFMHRHNLAAAAERDWRVVRNDLDQLARIYGVTWTWVPDAVRSSPLNKASTKQVIHRLEDAADQFRTSFETMRIGPVVTIAPLPRNFQAQGQRVGLGRMVNPSLNAVAREVRHELLSDLPYYSVFDWIEFEVLPDNTLVLRGEVTTPPDTKSRAEDVVKDVPGVTRVINEIQVLPVSPNDERLRRALFNAIYNFDSPLFRYSVGSRQAIHIIVDRGRATLKGVVDSEADRQLAYQRARGVSGLFAINNELRVEGESLVR